jgi:enoyl-CoA hydratase
LEGDLLGKRDRQLSIVVHFPAPLSAPSAWDAGKDFAWSTAQAAPTQKFMSMWRAPKPVIAQVHGWCVGGGSDTALCADLVIASEDARIGTPYSRMWGCYLARTDEGQGNTH